MHQAKKELYYQKRILDKVKKEGGWGYKNTMMAIGGIPDLVILLPGLPVIFLEVKHMFNERHMVDTTPLQDYTHTVMLKTTAMTVVLVACYINNDLYLFDKKTADGYIPESASRIDMTDGSLTRALTEIWDEIRCGN